ncbi:hypothetical protein DOTSEDRAFT_57066 [Dothistroma septosporum NZE10]|uniref:Uncharacterized protein n=1 Tax=Dothistroma septosporum (strain NZE10 / CBS 128990) TaxID=675120 RepID=M2WI46_DOTSN|nr:hypothetical protein DOTSEDRAFT_57066 [Dothistroma septosporum NZE10]
MLGGPDLGEQVLGGRSLDSPEHAVDDCVTEFAAPQIVRKVLEVAGKWAFPMFHGHEIQLVGVDKVQEHFESIDFCFWKANNAVFCFWPSVRAGYLAERRFGIDG